MLNLHRLRLLREIKIRGTLTAAADSLGYTSSSVSQQVAALEKEVGTLLLQPVGRRVRLTAQAEILVRHTDLVLAQLELAEAELAASIKRVTGTLRLALFQTAALALVPQTLGDLEKVLPDVEVVISEIDPDDALDALAAYDFDMIVGEEYPGIPVPRPAKILQEDLALDPLRLLLEDRLAQRLNVGANGATNLAALAEEAWVMEPLPNAARNWATALCRTAGFEPRVRFEANDLLLHVRLAETAHAVALLPDLVWLDGPPRGSLIDLPGSPCRRIFAASRRGDRMRPAITIFRDRLRESIARQHAETSARRASTNHTAD